MKTRRFLGISVLIALAFLAGFVYARWAGGSLKTAAGGKGGRKILYYVDPMHPAYKSDKPGIAPDCGMKLEPVYADQGASPASSGEERKILHYKDPQDPSYTSDKPGLNPETGNELEPVYTDAGTTGAPGSVQISAQKQQMIGVRYAQAEYAPVTDAIRAVGKIATDETRIAHVHAKVDGWIERVFVNFTGDLVKKGQPLLTMYSPELLASQQEFLLALKTREIMKHSTIQGAAYDSEAMVNASRERLRLWDLTPEQINKVERTQEPVKAITLYSPVCGFVMTRNAFANLKITPDTELYTVVDLSRVWVLASVFEHDAPQVRVGQNATIEIPSQAGKTYSARVSYIQPQVDPETRTVQVRIELNNPGIALKPEMFVNVQLGSRKTNRLTVPAEAVLDTGLTRTVFIDRGNGLFEPRQLETGQRIGDRIEVLNGLAQGDRVVTNGNFLISSESQLKSAVSGAAPAQPHAAHGTQTGPADAKAKPQQPSHATAPERKHD